MKRGSVGSRRPPVLDEEARVRVKHQGLLQEYLELQKEFVTKKRKLQAAKQKREILLAEVRFLRGRYRYLLQIQPPKPNPEQLQNSDIQSTKLPKRKNPRVNGVNTKTKKIAKAKSHISNGAVPKQPPSLADPIMEEGERREEIAMERLRVGKKPKNCSINDKKGKKKISWQDPVALKV